MTNLILKKLKRVPIHKLPSAITKKVYEEIYHFFNKRKALKGIWLSDKELFDKLGISEEFETWLKNRRVWFFTEYVDNEFIKKKFPYFVEKTLKEANKVLNHEFCILGPETVKLKEINWHQDFKTGFIWEKKYFKDLDILKLNFRCDVKVPWEISRFHHLFNLAKAFFLTLEDKYVVELENQITDWIRENPVDIGINWAISMEVSIRAVNLIWIFYLLDKVKSKNIELKKKILKLIYLSADHIYKNIEESPIVNANHYLSNGVGLLYVALAFPEFKETRKWYKRGLEIILNSMEKQVLEDGVSFEKSVHYHRSVTEFFLHVYLLLKGNDIEVPEWFEKKLEKMFEFIAYYTKPNGLCPLIGDNDNSRLLIFENEHLNDHRHLLSTATVLFKRGEFKKSCERLWADSYFLLGEKSIEIFEKIDPKELKSKAFFSGGFFIIREGNFHLIIDCGDLGLRGLGGHGHNDTLSFELFYGENFITDSGTFTYTRDYKERNKFRSTFAHNTPIIDEKELAEFDEVDLWYIKDKTNPKVLIWKVKSKEIIFKGEHNGYSPIKVARELRYFKNFLEIIDSISGDEKFHVVKIPFHLDNCEIIFNKKSLFCRKNNFYLMFEFDKRFQAEIKDCEISEIYGEKHKSKIVILLYKGKLPLRIKTKINFGVLDEASVYKEE
jgi:hypothetical protein